MPAAKAGGGGGGGGGGNRGGLLTSIEGFSKSGLRKAQTVDKSAPVLGRK